MAAILVSTCLLVSRWSEGFFDTLFGIVAVRLLTLRGKIVVKGVGLGY